MRVLTLLLFALTISATTQIQKAQAHDAPSQTDPSDNRIISAGASITEIIYALGAQQQLVATDVTSHKWHNGTLPNVGYHRQLTTEGLLALNPSILIASNEAGPDTTLQLLRQAGVDVAILNQGNHIVDLKQRIEQVAERTGHTAQATSLLAKVDALANQLQQQLPDPSQQQKVVFLLIRDGSPVSLAGRNTPADTIIQLMGATNPAAAQIESYKPASSEALLTMAPDVILVSQRSLQQLGGVEALLTAHPMLAATPAGQKQRIFSIEGTSLIGELGISSLHEAQRLHNLVYGN
ncbi:hemin ABC transporter substrate-binding protein [Motilimonas sp. KMU-193]|uniref:heme/hemin ABC transporter substrate-binding protein n=1 Tax=Motilimonas sp. KMU-193 TaxID=3388668 RepID=UPI00396B4113